MTRFSATTAALAIALGPAAAAADCSVGALVTAFRTDAPLAHEPGGAAVRTARHGDLDVPARIRACRGDWLLAHFDDYGDRFWTESPLAVIDDVRDLSVSPTDGGYRPGGTSGARERE